MCNLQVLLPVPSRKLKLIVCCYHCVVVETTADLVEQSVEAATTENVGTTNAQNATTSASSETASETTASITTSEVNHPADQLAM